MKHAFQTEKGWFELKTYQLEQLFRLSNSRLQNQNQEVYFRIQTQKYT